MSTAAEVLAIWEDVASGRAERSLGEHVPARTRHTVALMVDATWDALRVAGHDVGTLRRDVDAIRALPYRHA